MVFAGTEVNLVVDEDLEQVVGRWAAAERDGDTAGLDALLTDDFRAVGPLGFVLDKQQWLDRFGNGLSYDEVSWTDDGVRPHGGTAIAIGTQAQRGSFAGQSIAGQFRVTQVLVQQDGRWRVAGLHLSPIATPS